MAARLPVPLHSSTTVCGTMAAPGQTGISPGAHEVILTKGTGATVSD